MGKLSCYEFGRDLINSGDLDPVYILLEESHLNPVQQAHWLMAYWCFYHVGTACWIADGAESPHFYDRMEIAARSKEYPRSPERRHFRGAQALSAVKWIEEQTVGDLFAEFDRAAYQQRTLTAASVMEYVQEWKGFGPWISFKVADMLERLGICKVEFDTATAFYEGSPTEGAKMLWATENPEADEPTYDATATQQVTEWAAHRIVEELGDLDAPPRYERKINVQEAETVCCKWASYMKGRYHIGEDITACRKGLAWASTKRCILSQEMYRAGRRAELWQDF